MSLDAIGIVCNNTNESIDFYQILGVMFKEFGEGHFEGTTSNGTRLMIDSAELMKRINPSWKEVNGSNIILCFKQNVPSDVDEIFKELVAKGYKSIKDPWDAFWGQRYASILDPSNNQVDIFCPLDE